MKIFYSKITIAKTKKVGNKVIDDFIFVVDTPIRDGEENNKIILACLFIFYKKTRGKALKEDISKYRIDKIEHLTYLGETVD